MRSAFRVVKTKLCCAILVGAMCCFVLPARANIASTAYASNATNLTTGTVSAALLPVGTAENTVAAGNDVRFNTVATSQPSGTAPTGSVFIWVE